MATKLTFLELLGKDDKGRDIALYECECGNTREVPVYLAAKTGRSGVHSCRPCAIQNIRKARAEYFGLKPGRVPRERKLNKTLRWWLIRDRHRVLQAWERYQACLDEMQE